MFILKFFASIFLVFFALGLIFIIFSFFIAKNFLNQVNNSLNEKFNEDKAQKPNFSNDKNIPDAIECPLCGTFYAQMPNDNRCSCGAQLK